jgi:16S rRNA (cytidine1402-2'-O)-methyltransferase
MAPLFIACTPIGNPGDASTRLREAIESADLIAAEDSRKFQRLASDLNLRYRGDLLSLFEGNEASRSETLIAAIESGRNVLLLTDAGSPAVSDPGYRLIRDCIKKGLQLEVLPGPSAVITSLLYSGMPTDAFTFDGFIPRSDLAREAYFSRLLEERRSCIAFESPRRLLSTLEAAVKVLPGDREVAICREMSKEYQEIFRGLIGSALAWAKERESGEGIKGEITLVFSPASSIGQRSDEEILSVADILISQGLSVRDAVSQVAKELSLAKRYVYDLVIKRNESEESEEREE